MPLIVHVSITPLRNESRVLKEAYSFLSINKNSKVKIIGLWEDGLKENEVIDEKIEIIRMKLFSRPWPKNFFFQLLKYAEWVFRAVHKIYNYKPTIIHCHSLPCLPLCVIAKIFSRAQLIYDAHELETERNGMFGFRKKIAKISEGLLIKHANLTLVVSNSILEWYKAAYPGINILLIRNIPTISEEKEAPFSLRENISAKETDFIFIYCGALEEGRGIHTLCEVFKGLPKKYRMVFLGNGSLSGQIKRIDKGSQNIHLIPSVKPNEVVSITCQADIGFIISQSKALSYTLSLPNKFFEYIMGGTPIMVNKGFPDMENFLIENNCGWSVPGDVRGLINYITSVSRNDVVTKRKNCAKACELISWHEEAAKLLNFYQLSIINERT